MDALLTVAVERGRKGGREGGGLPLGGHLMRVHLYGNAGEEEEEEWEGGREGWRRGGREGTRRIISGGWWWYKEKGGREGRRC